MVPFKTSASHPPASKSIRPASSEQDGGCAVSLLRCRKALHRLSLCSRAPLSTALATRKEKTRSVLGDHDAGLSANEPRRVIRMREEVACKDSFRRKDLGSEGPRGQCVDKNSAPQERRTRQRVVSRWQRSSSGAACWVPATCVSAPSLPCHRKIPERSYSEWPRSR